MQLVAQLQVLRQLVFVVQLETVQELIMLGRLLAGRLTLQFELQQLLPQAGLLEEPQP